MPAEPVNVTLSEPIMAHGQSVSALTLRPMKAKDLRQCGDPRIHLNGAMRFDVAITSALIVALAGIPTSSVDQMALSDFDACQIAILGFFSPPSEAA